MIKLLLLLLRWGLPVLILFSTKIIAEEKGNNITEPKQQIIGATVGVQYHSNRWFDFNLNGYGGDIFYRCHTFSSISSTFSFFRHCKFYLSADAGYTNYERNDIKRKEIPVSAGCYVYVEPEDLFYWYCGIELGALYRKERKEEATSEYTKIFVGFVFSFLVPISDSLNLDIKLKEYWMQNDFHNLKFSAGFSYSF